MSYIDRAGMIARFGEEELITLTDRDQAGLIDDTVLDQAIADANATVDSYLAARVDLPLAVVPPSLSRVAADIARYLLYDEAPTEQVAERFDQAMAYLKDIARGQVRLPPDAAGAEPAGNGGVEMVSGGTVWQRGKGFL